MPKPNSDCCATERKHPWPMVRLGDVCKFSRGLTYSKSDEVQVSSNAVLRSNNVDLESGHLILDELKYIRDSIEIPTSKRVSKGSILMCTANGSKQHLGKVALIDGEYDYAFGGFMGLLTPNADIDSRYLYWHLVSFEFKRLVTSLTDGTNINNLKFADISQFTFPLPPLSVQREIVARLERELAAVEKMKKGFEALAETARAEFKAELKEVFEEISRGGAETRRLGDVCDVRDGTHDTPAKCNKGYLLLTSKNVRNGKVDKSNAYYISASDYVAINKRSGVDQWDVLFSMIGTVGETAIVDETPDFAIKNMGLLKTRANELLARWIKYFFDSQLAKQLILDRMKGANQKFLSLGALREFPLVLTNRDSMVRLVARLDSAKARAEKLEAKAREGVAVCVTMRKAILKESFA